ncbi:MAG: hypothetical protein Q8O84_00440 [Nanoarchaeota archaeon]|nr:hypothetical protein [Nanoarchaeota archaeon]
MKIEDHLRNINESLEVIEESIQKDIQDRQRNIGFNTSVAGVEMFEVFLHKENLLHPSSILKHSWFSSQKIANEKLKFDFQDKNKIIDLLCKIEEKRNILCYGKKRPVSEIKTALEYFNELKNLFESKGLKWN